MGLKLEIWTKRMTNRMELENFERHAHEFCSAAQ